ncbi:MAG: tyrosine-type recombinase/integrase, partial [Lentisphaeria bacterium]|nr:tyrosine-type recombinase/integrase [Lentisphaeria bacterium]
YSDCMKLLINHLCERLRIDPEAIDVSMITPERVLDFLDHLQKERGNGDCTRNQRLAAIKSFFHFLAATVPELMHASERIQAIKTKSADHRPPQSLTVEETQAIIARPQQGTLIGARDKALLQLMYNTGARVQELADLTVADLRLQAPATVTLTGKGRKTRVIPLWEETAGIINHYLQFRERKGIHSDCLFLSGRGGHMTRSAIGRRVAAHAEAAVGTCPSLRARKVTPHTFRHTAALHLIDAGNDIFVLKDWLGHAHIKTTSQYVEISVERKRKALEKVPPPGGGNPTEIPRWTQPAIMEFLMRCSRKEHYVT